MTKLNGEEKINLEKNEAVELINYIISNNTDSKILEISGKCNDVTKYLFSHQYLLYSDLNSYFGSSGLLDVLLSSLSRLPESSKRDVLRLVHMLLQAKKSLRDEARKSDSFQSFLRKSLDQADCWETRRRYKHHINIASLLLLDNDSVQCSFNTTSIRKLVRRTIDDVVSKNIQENEDVIPCVIFYACSIFTGEFEDVPKIMEDESISEKILTKEVTARFVDIVRDYIVDFKQFYTAETEHIRSQYVLYRPRSGYSFQQMCNTITYYAIQNKTLRMNLFSSGLYGLMNNFLSIKYIPEHLLLSGLVILKLPLLDEFILRSVKNDFLNLINEKLNIFLRNELFTDTTKVSIKDLLRTYDAPDIDSFDTPSGDVIHRPIGLEDSRLVNITIQSPNIVRDSRVPYYYEEWGHLDVDIWLADNHLENLRATFPNLTGRGLKQMHGLVEESNKVQIIDFIMDKIGISFESTLELIGALEHL